MNRGFLIIALFLAIGIGMYHYLQPQGNMMGNGDALAILIQNRHMEPNIVRVAKDSTVNLDFRTDEEGTVTVEDYNISIVTALGRPVQMSIPASRAGTFRILMSPLSAPRQSIHIGTLEVEAPRKGW